MIDKLDLMDGGFVGRTFYFYILNCGFWGVCWVFYKSSKIDLRREFGQQFQ
jgi:hypothetical protein